MGYLRGEVTKVCLLQHAVLVRQHSGSQISTVGKGWPLLAANLGSFVTKSYVPL